MFDANRTAECRAVRLDTPDDIAKLPWYGNHAFDVELFTRCDELIRRLAAADDMAGAARAIRLMCRHGMGMEEGADDADLVANYVAETI